MKSHALGGTTPSHVIQRAQSTHQDPERISETYLKEQSSSTSAECSMPDGARMAAIAEKDLTISQGLKRYRWAVIWSLIATTSIVMEGFDLALMTGFYAFPPFKEKFGDYSAVPNKQGEHFEIPPGWQTAFSASAQIGQIIGLCIAGVAAPKVGYKKTIICALIMMIGFIFILFFSQHRWMILLAEIMQGVPWGVFETMPVAYASEISPMVLRPYITTYANLCWVMGQLIASGVLRGCLTIKGEQAYRIPMALQWIWPVPIVVVMYFAPESPCWLARNGQLDKARCSLRKLTNYDAEESENHLDLIKHTVLLERKNDSDEGTSRTIWGRVKRILGPCRDCFQSVDRRRTEISCGAWICQSLCGSNLMAFAPYFFEKAGLQSDTSFTIQLVTLSLGAGGTVFAWVLMNNVGRRRIYVFGLWCLFALLLAIGLLAAAANAPGVPWAVSILLGVFIVVYDITVGPCCYSIVTEIPSTRLRATTVAIARMCYNVCGIFSVVINPLMLNDRGWDWGPKAALLWAGLCFICGTWAYFRLPEPKGRSYGDLDTLFNLSIRARDFKNTDLDEFGSDIHYVGTSTSVPPEVLRRSVGLIRHESSERELSTNPDFTAAEKRGANAV